MLRRGEGEDVGDDAHRGGGRIDIGVADHELFQDVVLNGPRQRRHRDALLFRRDDEQRQHRQHRAVHRHRHAHRIERDAGKERAHVIDRVDRDPGHADVAGDARMVGIVAAMGREIESDGESLLAGGEIGAIEGVRLLGGRKAGVLAHRPRLVDIHRGIGPAQIGRKARPVVRQIEPGAVGGAVERLDVDSLGRRPHACLVAFRASAEAAAKGVRVKSGIWVMGVFPRRSGRDAPIEAFEGRDRVAAGEDEVVDSGRAQSRFRLARTPGEGEALDSRRLDRPGARLRPGGVSRVVAAEAREFGAARLECASPRLPASRPRRHRPARCRRLRTIRE